MSTPQDRRQPVSGNGYELRARMAQRVPVDRYTSVLNTLLQRVNGDLQHIETGRLSDTVSEKAAREELRAHLTDARDYLLGALGSIQRISDPRMRFTLGLNSVGPVLTKEGLVGDATQIVRERHARGRWGDATAEEREANEAAVLSGIGRIISRHRLGVDEVVVFTDADRSSTHVMTIERY